MIWMIIRNDFQRMTVGSLILMETKQKGKVPFFMIDIVFNNSFYME